MDTNLKTRAYYERILEKAKKKRKNPGVIYVLACGIFSLFVFPFLFEDMVALAVIISLALIAVGVVYILRAHGAVNRAKADLDAYDRAIDKENRG